jgi:hypothetical protein
MRKDLFGELVASVKQMKEIQAGTPCPSRLTPGEDVERAVEVRASSLGVLT